jgi:hypothetical protein
MHSAAADPAAMPPQVLCFASYTTKWNNAEVTVYSDPKMRLAEMSEDELIAYLYPSREQGPLSGAQQVRRMLCSCSCWC